MSIHCKLGALFVAAASLGVSFAQAADIKPERIRGDVVSFKGEILTVHRNSGADDARHLRDAAVKAERQELIRLWRENQISDEVLHHIEEDLDYQESRI